MLFFSAKPSVALQFEEMITKLETRPELRKLLQDADPENNVEYIRHEFNRHISKLGEELPFPIFYNADKSFAILVYGIARYVSPNIAIETGVGYGITSGLILLALKNSGKGVLRSIDLHPLSDPKGSLVGIGVPKDLRQGWNIYSGSSRRWLPKILRELGPIDLFVSDSANVFTLQKYEFDRMLPQLNSNGAMIFNNASLRFQEYLRTVTPIEYFTVWQSEKLSCATIIVFKTPEQS